MKPFSFSSVSFVWLSLRRTDETFLNKDLSQEQKELEIFEKEGSDNNLNTKEESKEEAEMFENSQTEEDFEIPAFLRRQKN